MEVLRQHGGIASTIVGVVLIVVVVIFSPGGDLVSPFVGSAAAVALAVAMYLVLRRSRADSD